WSGAPSQTPGQSSATDGSSASGRSKTPHRAWMSLCSPSNLCRPPPCKPCKPRPKRTQPSAKKRCGGGRWKNPDLPDTETPPPQGDAALWGGGFAFFTHTASPYFAARGLRRGRRGGRAGRGRLG